MSRVNSGRGIAAVAAMTAAAGAGLSGDPAPNTVEREGGIDPGAYPFTDAKGDPIDRSGALEQVERLADLLATGKVGKKPAVAQDVLAALGLPKTHWANDPGLSVAIAATETVVDGSARVITSAPGGIRGFLTAIFVGSARGVSGAVLKSSRRKRGE